MPKENCPQAHAWCPHHDPNRCKPVSDTDEPCIHAKSLVTLRAELSVLMTVYGDRISPELKNQIESLLKTI